MNAEREKPAQLVRVIREVKRFDRRRIRRAVAAGKRAFLFDAAGA